MGRLKRLDTPYSMVADLIAIIRMVDPTLWEDIAIVCRFPKRQREILETVATLRRIIDAAEHFNVSREAIHNHLRGVAKRLRLLREYLELNLHEPRSEDTGA